MAEEPVDGAVIGLMGAVGGHSVRHIGLARWHERAVVTLRDGPVRALFTPLRLFLLFLGVGSHVRLELGNLALVRALC